MRREFFLTLDPQVLAVRYGWVTLLRAFWQWFLTRTDLNIVQTVLPNPFSTTKSLLQGFGALLSGNFGLSAALLVDGFLGFLQLSVVVGAAMFALERFRPELCAHVPFFFGDKHGAGYVLDAKRLRRPWWVLPVLLSLAVIVTLYVLTGWIATAGGGYRAPRTIIAGMAQAGPIPLYIGLGLGAMGLLWGYRFNASAAALPAEHPLTQRVHKLARQLELPLPKVGVTNVVNAYAVGGSIKDAMVVLGVPLIQHLTDEQLDAVIGHELGHIISGDMRQMQFAEGYQRMFGDVFYGLGRMIGTIGAGMSKSRSTAALSEMTAHAFALLGRSLLNISGEMATKGLSRSREFYADAIGAALTSPAAMIGALENLHKIPNEPTEAEHEYAYMMFKGGSLRWIFSTHPDVEKRKLALERKTHLRLLPMRKG
jgi:Zn-dependent protease with chaperone function